VRSSAAEETNARQLLVRVLVDTALGEWTRRGLCTQADPEIFFPPKGNSGIEAKQICAGCPVRAECLAYAIEADEEFGIWGGLNRNERLKVREALQVRKQGLMRHRECSEDT